MGLDLGGKRASKRSHIEQTIVQDKSMMRKGSGAFIRMLLKSLTWVKSEPKPVFHSTGVECGTLFACYPSPWLG